MPEMQTIPSGRVCDYDEKGECAETIGVNEVAQPCNEPSKDEKDGFAGETDDGKVNECSAEPPSSEAKTMKMKTWTVITNTGNQAELESGIDKRQFKSRRTLVPKICSLASARQPC